MRIPSTRKLTPSDIDDAADLLDDAASGVELKDTGPDAMQSKAAKEYVVKLLIKLSYLVQHSKP